MALKVNHAALAALSPAEREVAAAQLADVEAQYRANPLLKYEPHLKQVEFHRAPHPPLRAFFGGNRSGKTTAGVVDRLLQQVDRDLVPARLASFKRWEPPCFGRIVTPDLTSTLDGVVHEKIRDWCPPGQLKGGSFDRAFDKVQRVLRFKNGSWIQFNSSEQDREKLGGVALHWVLYDEEPREEVRKECLARLIDFNGDEVFTLTPFSGMKWLYDEVYEPWERGAMPEAEGRVVIVDMDDNPYISEEGKKRVLALYSGPEREARKSGRFVSFQGLIYPGFGERHVVPAADRVAQGAEVFCGIDPGIRHMCAVVFCWLDSNDELVVFDELALVDSTVRVVCAEIQRRLMRWGVRLDDGRVLPLKPNWFVIDPASKNRNNQTGRSDQQEFSDHGIPTVPGQNDVRAGINRTLERIEAGKLKVCANCGETLKEFKRYRWIQDSGRREDAPKEAPVKKDDHLLDALRYVVMQRPLRPDPEMAIPTTTQKDRLLRASLKRLRQGGQGRKSVDHPSGPGVFS